jgi:hypothetical protein
VYEAAFIVSSTGPVTTTEAAGAAAVAWAGAGVIGVAAGAGVIGVAAGAGCGAFEQAETRARRNMARRTLAFIHPSWHYATVGSNLRRHGAV